MKYHRLFAQQIGRILIVFFFLTTTSLFSDQILKTADILYLEGHSREALEIYCRWLPQTKNYTHPEFQKILFRTVSIIDDPLLSIKTIERFLPALKNVEKRVDALFFAAAQAELMSDNDNSYRLYQKALALIKSSGTTHPAYWQISYRCAASAAEKGARVEAANLLKPIISNCPDGQIRSTAALLYSRMLAEQKRVPESIQTASLIYRMGIKLYPPVAQYWISFLIENYPEEAAILRQPYQNMVRNQKFYQTEAVASPSMILAGLIEESEITRKSPNTGHSENVNPVVNTETNIIAENLIPKDDGLVASDGSSSSLEKDVVPLIQVGSFKDSENADYFSKDVSGRGFETEVRYSAANGYYRVFVVSNGKEPLGELMVHLKDSGLEGYLVFE